MRISGAAIALAILFGGFSLASTGAQARSNEARAGKPAARSAAPATPTAARSAARPAAASTTRSANQRSRNVAARSGAASRSAAATRRGGRTASAQAATRSFGISCVPYARQATGMAISGNGREWWHNAAGVYARNNRPEIGSVMAFPGSGRMRSGHVAVVERVVSPREVLIHHANWGGPGIRRGSIMRGVSVIDVSPNNNWTQVRVQVGHSSEAYGRVYPVYGFIHNRPDGSGTMMAGGAGTPRVNAAQAAQVGLEEVAQAPGRGSRR